MSTACASSVSLLNYRNTILNQLARIFALGYFLMDVVLHVYTKVMFYWNHTFLVGFFLASIVENHFQMVWLINSFNWSQTRLKQLKRADQFCAYFQPKMVGKVPF